MASRKLDLTTLILQFEVHNRSEGKSPATVAWYNEALEFLLRWLQEEGMSTLLEDLGRRRSGSSYSTSRRERATGVLFPAIR